MTSYIAIPNADFHADCYPGERGYSEVESGRGSKARAIRYLRSEPGGGIIYRLDDADEIGEQVASVDGLPQEAVCRRCGLEL